MRLSNLSDLHWWRQFPKKIRHRTIIHALELIPDDYRFRAGTPSMAGLLRNIRSNGFKPETIIDIGANVGTWSMDTHGIFPAAQYFMLEGNPENEARLKLAQATIGEGCEYVIALLGPEDRPSVSFHVLGTGSSVMPDLTSFPRSIVELPMRTLDAILAEHSPAKPMLMKLDVQGFELEILRGALNTLTSADVVILETSLIPYNAGSPLFAEVVGFMDSAGLVAYDFCGQYRRESDHTLFQTDVMFVKRGSELRNPKKFWLHEP